MGAFAQTLGKFSQARDAGLRSTSDYRGTLVAACERLDPGDRLITRDANNKQSHNR